MAKPARVASQWPQREAPRLVSTFHTDNPSLPLREPPAAVVRGTSPEAVAPNLARVLLCSSHLAASKEFDIIEASHRVGRATLA
jgi:hypothetical protein